MLFQEGFLFPLTNTLNRLKIKNPQNFLAHLHTVFVLCMCNHAIQIFIYANTTAQTWFQQIV